MKMKHLAVTALTSMMATTVMAAPSVAKIGVCTVFDNGNVISKSTCSITINHTSTTKTTILKLAKDKHTIVAVHGGKDYAKAAFYFDGVPAQHYLRDANTNKRISMGQVQLSEVDTLTCYETNTSNICHS